MLHRDLVTESQSHLREGGGSSFHCVGPMQAKAWDWNTTVLAQGTRRSKPSRDWRDDKRLMGSADKWYHIGTWVLDQGKICRWRSEPLIGYEDYEEVFGHTMKAWFKTSVNEGKAECTCVHTCMSNIHVCIRTCVHACLSTHVMLVLACHLLGAWNKSYQLQLWLPAIILCFREDGHLPMLCGWRTSSSSGVVKRKASQGDEFLSDSCPVWWNDSETFCWDRQHPENRCRRIHRHGNKQVWVMFLPGSTCYLQQQLTEGGGGRMEESAGKVWSFIYLCCYFTFAGKVYAFIYLHPYSTFAGNVWWFIYFCLYLTFAGKVWSFIYPCFYFTFAGKV